MSLRLNRTALRRLIRPAVIAFSCAVALMAGAVLAQTTYPQRPVQVIVGFPAGGSVDVMARNLVTAVTAQLGGSFVVVNRDGSSGTIGFGQVAAAPPDGYTLDRKSVV